MKVETCGSSGPKVIVVPEPIGCCTFVEIDSWDQDKYPKDCETMYILSDKSGAYFWNGSEWVFLTFGASGDFVTNGTFEAFKTDQDTRDDEQDAKINSLESQIPKITQIRTTIGVNGREDSSIFNPDVISNADLLWTKQELPEGNLVSVNGNFTVKTAQTDSYKNVFWTTPEGFELLDNFVQFVPIMHWTPVTSSSLNPNVDVSGVKAWTNFASLSADVFMIDKTLRAK